MYDRVAMDATTLRVLALVTVSLGACSAAPRQSDAERGVDGGGGDAKPDAKTAERHGPRTTGPDPCDPATLGLGAAKPVAPWAAPAGCTATSSATPGPATIRSDAEFAARFRCPAGTASGIDFATHQLMVEDRDLSPAGAGTSVVDDGAKVTSINRFRSPCPGDPQPMPMPYTLAYLLPRDAKRVFAETTCTLSSTCK